METDEQIVKKVIEGNKELYTELVKRYEKKLERYIGYIIKNKEWIADILQDTFIKAYENLNGFNTTKKFSSWIYRIAHNESINRINKEKRITLGLDLDIFESVWYRQPEEEYEKEETSKQVRYCLDKLPLKYKETLSLFFLEDKKYEEISDILRISIGTVGTRINRGKNLLRQLCQK